MVKYVYQVISQVLQEWATLPKSYDLIQPSLLNENSNISWYPARTSCVIARRRFDEISRADTNEIGIRRNLDYKSPDQAFSYEMSKISNQDVVNIILHWPIVHVCDGK